MENKGKLGGVAIANGIGIAEITALSQALSGFANLSYKSLSAIILLIIFQIFIGWYLGAKWDKKRTTSRDVVKNIRTRDFAYEIFDTLTSMATRDNTKLSIFLLSINDVVALKNKLGEETVTEMEHILISIIQSTIRKGDVFAIWDGDSYIIIAADRGHRESTMIQRIKQRMNDAIENKPFKIPIIYGAVEFPTEGATLDDLTTVAQERMYQNRNNNK